MKNVTGESYYVFGKPYRLDVQYSKFALRQSKV